MIRMSPEQVIEHYGSQAATAKALGLSQPSIWEWFQNGKVPQTRQYQIELATSGKLRADKPADRTAIQQTTFNGRERRRQSC